MGLGRLLLQTQQGGQINADLYDGAIVLFETRVTRVIWSGCGVIQVKRCPYNYIATTTTTTKPVYLRQYWRMYKSLLLMWHAEWHLYSIFITPLIYSLSNELAWKNKLLSINKNIVIVVIIAIVVIFWRCLNPSNESDVVSFKRECSIYTVHVCYYAEFCGVYSPQIHFTHTPKFGYIRCVTYTYEL